MKKIFFFILLFAGIGFSQTKISDLDTITTMSSLDRLLITRNSDLTSKALTWYRLMQQIQSSNIAFTGTLTLNGYNVLRSTDTTSFRSYSNSLYTSGTTGTSLSDSIAAHNTRINTNMQRTLDSLSAHNTFFRVTRDTTVSHNTRINAAIQRALDTASVHNAYMHANRDTLGVHLLYQQANRDTLNNNVPKLWKDNAFAGDNTFAQNIGTPTYASQTTGWRIDNAGYSDFRSVFADKQHARSFVSDMESAISAGQIIAKASVTLYQGFSTGGTPWNEIDTVYESIVSTWENLGALVGGTSPLVVDAFSGFPSVPVFANSDVVRVRSFTRTAGSLTVTDAWGTVTLDTAYGSSGYNTTLKTQGYRFTKVSGDEISALEGALVIDYGTAGNGVIESVVSDAAGAPYIDIKNWATNPYTDITTKARLGNLAGITDAYFGSLSGFGLYAQNAYLTGGIVATSGTIGGLNIANYTLSQSTNLFLSSATKKIAINDTTFGNTGIQLEYNGGTPRFFAGNATKYLKFDGTSMIWSSDSSSIDASGNLTANNITVNRGTFSGDISSSATITGGTLQTASSGKRIVIDETSNNVDFYDASNVNIGRIGDAYGTLPGMRFRNPAHLIFDSGDEGFTSSIDGLKAYAYLSVTSDTVANFILKSYKSNGGVYAPGILSFMVTSDNGVTTGITGRVQSVGVSTGNKIGVYGEASGTNASATNIGVYGYATGGGTNYAGYFDGAIYSNSYGDFASLKTNGTERISSAGALSNITTITASSYGDFLSLKTNGTERISSAGALSNITTLAMSGAITGATTINASRNFVTDSSLVMNNWNTYIGAGSTLTRLEMKTAYWEFYVGSNVLAMTLDGSGNTIFSGTPKFTQSASGSTTVGFGSSSPSVGTLPYVWITAVAPDGSTVYIPAWK